MIDKNFKVEDDEGYVDGDIRVRFESVIEFPYFLLHTLKVYINLYSVVSKDSTSKIVDELLDNKKLLEAFDRVVTGGFTENGEIAQNKGDFARSFIMCLLRTRYLFDKYIVKREYTSDNTDGEWSLKSLYVSGRRSKKKAYYRNTKFTRSGESASINDQRNKTNIMMQSALRVSYTSPKIMHWITKLLIWLSESDCKNIKSDSNYNIQQSFRKYRY